MPDESIRIIDVGMIVKTSDGKIHQVGIHQNTIDALLQLVVRMEGSVKLIIPDLRGISLERKQNQNHA